MVMAVEAMQNRIEIELVNVLQSESLLAHHCLNQKGTAKKWASGLFLLLLP